MKSSNKSNRPSKDPLKYGCLVCKDNVVYNYPNPSFHNSATGAYVCRSCSKELYETKELRLQEEKRKAAGEDGEMVYKHSNNEDKVVRGKWRLAEEKGLWSLLLSSDISSWPLASKGIKAYSLYRLQTIKDNPIKPVADEEPNVCHAGCPCPYRKYKNNQDGGYLLMTTEHDESPYPVCQVCDNVSFTVGGYNKYIEVKINCGHLYCVECDAYICDEHRVSNEHHHPRTLIVTYEQSFALKNGLLPQYVECWLHRTPYAYIDMSVNKPTCEKCCENAPNRDYLYFRKAGNIVRDRLASALTTAVRKNSLSSSTCSSDHGTRRQAGKGSAIDQQRCPLYSIPELIRRFKDVEVPLFELLQVLCEIDDIIRRMLPVTKVKKKMQVESKTLGKSINVRVDEYKTPLDEQADTCRRLWGEVSNDLIKRVEVYAKSRFGIARSLEHCLESLNVSSLLMPNESTESKQEVAGTRVSDRTGRRQGGIGFKKEVSTGPKERAASTRRRKVVTKDDILNVLNQVPLTKERVSEELMYLTTIECLRETIEYGDPHFFILTMAKVESIATRLKPTLLQLKKQVLALKGRRTLDISFVNELKTVISQYSSSLKGAGKAKAWLFM